MTVDKTLMQASDIGGNEVTTKTVMLLLAITLNAFEFFIPRIPIFPWLKPGLANCVTILWVIKFGGADALLFTFLRLWIVAFYFGFAFPTIVLGLSGGALSTVMMAAAWKLTRKKNLMGYAGIGVIGALSHNTGQLIAVYLTMVRNSRLFLQFPVMIAASVVFGTLVSLLVPVLAGKIDSVESRLDTFHHSRRTETGGRRKSELIFACSTLILCIALIFVESPLFLATAAIAATILVQLIYRFSARMLLAPLTRFWILFISISAFHLFLSYGRRIPHIPFVTQEGLHAAGIQCLRIWTWLQLTFVLDRYGFQQTVFSALTKIFLRHPETMYAGMKALELFPRVTEIVRARALADFAQFLRNPVKWGKMAVENTIEDIGSAATTRRESL